MALPLLTVRGNRIVEQGSGQPVLLRGVNRSGLEYSSPDGAGSLAKAGITEAELVHIVTDWSANIVRLPLNQEWALARTDYDPGAYLAAIDFVIDTLERHGAYTLLDLQWLNSRNARGTIGGKPNFAAPLPDGDSLELWRQLATRWRKNSAVLYDIFNEPHAPLPDDEGLHLVLDQDGATQMAGHREVRAAEWHPWAERLIEVIRSIHPAALIFVSGLNWGYDLSSFPLAAASDVVYSTHVYPNKGKRWNTSFGDLSRRVPVFAAEWGGGVQDLRWANRLATYFSEHEIGWTAWSWSDHPHLIQPNSPLIPSDFGELVRALLRGEA